MVSITPGESLMLTNKNLDAVVDRRYDMVLLFDVTDGNPNGDPDAGNLPRLDPQSMQGIVSDVCLKRKVRNAVAALAGDRPGCNLYFQTQDAVYEKRVLNLLHQQAYDTLRAEGQLVEETTASGRADNTARARGWMCRQFYDVRAFGAVMTLGTNCGQVRGAVQMTFARSIDPIVPLEVSITRKSVATKDEAEKQVKKDGYITGTMGRKNLVPYGLYRTHLFINPFLARDTGFTYRDLGFLCEALRGQMWELDRSASRGLMATRGLYAFEHESPLGNAPSHELFDRVRVRPFSEDAEPRAPRRFTDYRPRLTVPAGALPPGVTLHRLVHLEE
jgi:CRISPR-associated protein Csd2